MKKVKEVEKQVPPEYQMNLKDLTGILIKNYEINEGFFEASISFAITVGAIQGPDKITIPGIAAGIVGIGLIPSTKESINAVDAAAVK